jgi:hypothetical protein
VPCGVLFCVLQLVLVAAAQHPGAQALTYLHSKGTEARVKAATHWVVTDLSTPRYLTAGQNHGTAGFEGLTRVQGLTPRTCACMCPNPMRRLQPYSPNIQCTAMG